MFELGTPQQYGRTCALSQKAKVNVKEVFFFFCDWPAAGAQFVVHH
jgi:hypothetical protein